MIAKKYQNTLDKVKPYIFSYGKNWDHFDLDPFGIEIIDSLKFDCTKSKSESFFNLITKMDALTFGDQGMGMDRWVLYDCSAMPGAIFGFAAKVSDLPKSFLAKIAIDSSYHGYIPLSMFIAIPMAEKNCWFGHNLSSLNSYLGGSFKGLGLLTKLFGLKVMQIKKQYGATQWNNPALLIHSKLSKLKLITSYTPIHTHKHTLTYLAYYTKEHFEDVLSDKLAQSDEGNFELKGLDRAAQQQLQKDIEKGASVTILPNPNLVGEEFIYQLVKE